MASMLKEESLKENEPQIQQNKRFYVREEVVTFEEDQTHEFKGHRNICTEEIPPWCLSSHDSSNKTRSAISRNICGFLNTGQGGTVYLGILDDGAVEGVRMTPYQKDHLVISLQDTLDRFRPPVPRHLYHTSFITVIDKDDDYPSDFIPIPRDVCSKKHTLHSYLYCWCDYEALSRFHHGIIPLSYVVEITVLHIDPKSTWVRELMPEAKFPTLPVFQADDAQIYCRKHSTLVKYSSRDVEEQAKEEILLRKMPELIEVWKKDYTYKRLCELVQELTTGKVEADH